MQELLKQLKIKADVVSVENNGVMSKYFLRLLPGGKVNKIERCAPEIALGLKAFSIPIIKLIPEHSTLTDNSFGNFIRMHPKSDWRDNKTPMVQITPQIIFATDEKDLEIELLPPFLHYKPDFPCITSAARFNIYNWTRAISVVLEWMDIKKPIIFKRGDPMTYIRFNKDVNLVFINNSQEIIDLVQEHSELKKHIKYFTKEAMKIGARFRPRKLL